MLRLLLQTGRSGWSQLATSAAISSSPSCVSDSVFSGSQAFLRAYATAESARLHFCIVGSGPAGFYTADKLLKKYGQHARVDLVDQLPTPFGLVRSGVAPDHPETKNVEHHFTEIAQDPRCTFVGNVMLGHNVQLADLRKWYSGVVLAYGAESDRRLGIPGEDAPGVLSARKFVWWYNGHPSGADESVDLCETKNVAVLGIGNVALDCARLLLSPVDRLAPTDVAERALQQLRHSAVQNVHLVARRGVTEAACTPKELRELLGIVGPNVHLNIPAVPANSKAPTQRIKKRLQDIFRKAALASAPQPGARQVHFNFLRQPREVLTDAAGRACAVKIEKMVLQASPEGDVRAVGTGQFEEIPSDLVLVSIGYSSVPIGGVGFDSSRGVIMNRGGRVLGEDGSELEGVYACGWLMRGPTGIIGTNMANAEYIADVIGEDTAKLQLVHGKEGGTQALLDALGSKGVHATGFHDWCRIDAAELEAGQQRGKVREKFATMPDLLQAAAVSETMGSAVVRSG